MPARKKKLHPPVESQHTAEKESRHAAGPTPEVQPLVGDTEPPTAAAHPAEGEHRRQWQPDPFPLMSVTLGNAKDSPVMKLYRNNRFNQMAIRFDAKPADKYRRLLHDAGWQWRDGEGVWTKQLDRERRAASQVEAERLFAEIGDAIRAELGLSGRTGVGG